MRRGSAPFAISLAIHLSALGWVALGPRSAPPEKRQSLYEREIAPHEKKLVWYRFNEKLPNVGAPESSVSCFDLEQHIHTERITVASL